MKLYDHIIERLPCIEGYGETGKTYNDDGRSNHSVFKQSIRENAEGDVGVFVTTSSEITKMSGHSMYRSEVQIVVNCVNGDIDGALSFLNQTLENIRKNPKGDKVWIKSTKLVNMSPVGKNSSGIHWCVLNLLLTYIVNEN